jgi:hypothetical protein
VAAQSRRSRQCPSAAVTSTPMTFRSKYLPF